MDFKTNWNNNLDDGAQPSLILVEDSAQLSLILGCLQHFKKTICPTPEKGMRQIICKTLTTFLFSRKKSKNTLTKHFFKKKV